MSDEELIELRNELNEIHYVWRKCVALINEALGVE